MAISDIAKAAAAGAIISDGACGTCRALASLPEAEAAALRELLGNPKVRYTELSQALADDEDNPLDIHSDTLGKHARGGCAARERLR